MNYTIVKNIERSSEDYNYSKYLANFGVATLSDAQDGTGLMNQYIRPIQSGASIAGTAVTVECISPDNLMIHAALEFCKRGDVLVVSTPQNVVSGFFGELMANAAKKRGVVALIIDGGVRDIKAVRDLGFPIWSKYICAKAPTKNNPGNVNQTITCGNVNVNPGDFIVADDDGVIVISRKNIKIVLKKAYEIVAKDKENLEKIKNGELSIDYDNLRKVLESYEIVYQDYGASLKK